jgi:carbon storage regulator
MSQRVMRGLSVLVDDLDTACRPDYLDSFGERRVGEVGPSAGIRPTGLVEEPTTRTASGLGKGYAPMLVLSRKKNESIVINNDITVTVVEIRGDKVRLGIVAPKEVPVHRQEVYDAIHGKEAADAATPVVVNKPNDTTGR